MPHTFPTTGHRCRLSLARCLMWGRFSTCGRFSIGLPTSVQKPPRRVTNPPQVENLPHKFCSIPNTGKSMRHWAVSPPSRPPGRLTTCPTSARELQPFRERIAPVPTSMSRPPFRTHCIHSLVLERHHGVHACGPPRWNPCRQRRRQSQHRDPTVSDSGSPGVTPNNSPFTILVTASAPATPVVYAPVRPKLTLFCGWSETGNGKTGRSTGDIAGPADGSDPGCLRNWFAAQRAAHRGRSSGDIEPGRCAAP
jgi:hypothetical protein